MDRCCDCHILVLLSLHKYQRTLPEGDVIDPYKSLQIHCHILSQLKSESKKYLQVSQKGI